MRSVADDLREQQQREIANMTPAERVEKTLELSELGVQFFMASNGLTRRQALEQIRRSRRDGRIASGCLDAE